MKKHKQIYDFMWLLRTELSRHPMLHPVNLGLQNLLINGISWQIEDELWFSLGYSLFVDLTDNELDRVVGQVMLGPKMMGS